MMRGTWIAGAARRFFREDTFALIVSPAVADLQCECESGDAITAFRGYVGISRAIAGGLFHDLRTDVELLSRDATDLLQILAMQVCYYGALLTLVGGAAFGELSHGGLILIGSTVVSLALIPTLICFWPESFARATTIE